MWAPVVFNLLNILALRFLFRALTGSRRLVWLSLWLFFITNCPAHSEATRIGGVPAAASPFAL